MQIPIENNEFLQPEVPNALAQISHHGDMLKVELEKICNQLLKLNEAYSRAKLQEVLRQLNKVAEYLNDNELKKCSLLLRPLQEKLLSALANIMDDDAVKGMLLPTDLVMRGVGPYLPYRSLLSLATSCRFFAKHPTLKKSIIQAKHPRIQIATGFAHTLILDSEKSLFVFGENHFGQLGLGHKKNKSTPQLLILPGDKVPCQVVAGRYHSFVLCEDGSLFGFGNNGNYQLGFIGLNKQTTPKLLTLPDGNQPCQVAAGSFHSFILCKNGLIFSVGGNTSGQLGVVSREKVGLLSQQGTGTPLLFTLPEGNEPCQVVSGDHSFVLCKNGSLWGFGNNENGQLLGRKSHQAIPKLITLPGGKVPHQVVTGGQHSLVLCEDGTLFGFGNNVYGQLILGDERHQTTPKLITLPDGKVPHRVAAGNFHSLVLCKDGSLFIFGAHHGITDQDLQLLTLPDGRIPCQVAAGNGYSLILCEDGSLFSFGRNEAGQLGLGHNIDQLDPIRLVLPSRQVIEKQNNHP